MAGSVLSTAVVGFAAACLVGLSGVGASAAFAQRLAGAADAAALAAADAASGALRGVPCERAGEVAEAAGATIARCAVDGLIADVTVTAAFGRLVATASARAGPAPAAEFSQPSP